VTTLGVRLAAIAMLVFAVAFAGCGGDDGDDGSGRAEGNSAERAFLEAMVPHHESAIAMAEVAVDRAEEPEIKKLAQAINDAQGPEIAQMGRIHRRLFRSELRPNPAAHEQLGLSPEEAAMEEGDPTRELRRADPFERAFIDMMVPHHRGAVRMAEAVLERTRDGELRGLARAIISAQNREIKQMNDFRTEHYGGPVPEGGGEPGDEGH
jgi:uncharacterized protein (DUF305 family)